MSESVEVFNENSNLDILGKLNEIIENINIIDENNQARKEIETKVEIIKEDEEIDENKIEIKNDNNYIDNRISEGEERDSDFDDLDEGISGNEENIGIYRPEETEKTYPKFSYNFDEDEEKRDWD